MPPTTLIRETARLARRRERFELFAITLPPAGAVATLFALGRMPFELAVAGAIVGFVVGLHAIRVRLSETAAATAIDRTLGGKDRFLTIATTPSGGFLPFVEADAARLAGDAPPSRFAPPTRFRYASWSLALSLAAVLAVLWFPVLVPAPDPVARLEAAAEALAKGSAADRALARELAMIADRLRKSEASDEEKRSAAAEAMKKVEEKRQGGQGSGKGEAEKDQGKGEGAGKGEGGGETGKGAGGASEGSESKGGGKSGGDPTGKGGDESKGETGGGVQGPESEQQGTKQREGQGEGNRPAEKTEGRQSEARGSGDAEGASDPSKEGPQPEGKAGTGERKGGAEGGEGAGNRATAGDSTEPAERYFEAGDGPGGRIVDGRYVRIRVPDEEGGEATERVQKPGTVETETPYGNAPLPGPGGPGEVRDSQPLPLEYRDVLGGRRAGGTR